jgi:hypothetical protein
MSDLNLQAVHDELISVAYEAGAMILAANPAELDTDTKLNCMLPFPPTHPLHTLANTDLQLSTSSQKRTRVLRRWSRHVYHHPFLTSPSWARRHTSLA